MRIAIRFYFLACAFAQDSLVDQAASAAEHPLAFTFSPGGLLFPYYVGVAFQLRDLGLLRTSTPIGGSSAGAVIAAAIACGLEESTIRKALAQLLEDARNGGELKEALRKQLEAVVPEDAAERARRHGLRICYLEVFPRFRPQVATSWKSKQDLIETVIASCNFPVPIFKNRSLGFFFSKWPLVKCRDAWCVDGFFAVKRSRFGCPVLPGDRTVAVLSLPSVRTAFNASDIIQPKKPGMELPRDVGSSQWFAWALAPAPDDAIEKMIVVGREHAKAWFADEQDYVSTGASRVANTDLNRGSVSLPPKAMPQHLRVWRPEFMRTQLSPRLWRSPFLRPWPSTARMPRFLDQTYLDVISIPFVVLIGCLGGTGASLAVLRTSRC